MVSEVEDPQKAPGQLEQIRTLLNTWRIPNDRRVPEDSFERYALELALTSAQAGTLHELRNELREVVEGISSPDAVLTDWIGRLGIRPVVREETLQFDHPGGYVGDVITVVLHAIADGSWSRLKACPDCHWVFYDHTRNRSKRWCVMNARTPSGRGCGNIAKVTRYRERHGSSTESV